MILNEINATQELMNKSSVLYWRPDESCFDWCLNQKVTSYNNLELTSTLFVLGAILMIFIYEYLNEKENLRKYAPYFVFYAKILLYMFFFYYLVVIRLGMYQYGI